MRHFKVMMHGNAVRIWASDRAKRDLLLVVLSLKALLPYLEVTTAGPSPERNIILIRLEIDNVRCEPDCGITCSSCLNFSSAIVKHQG